MKLQSKYVIALLCAMFCALHADSLPQLVEETDELEKDSSVFRKTSYYPTLTVGALTVQQPAIFNNGVTVTAGGMTASGPVLVNGTSGVGPQGPAGATGTTGSQGIQGEPGTNGINGTVLGYGFMYSIAGGTVPATGGSTIPMANSGLTPSHMTCNTTPGVTNGIQVNNSGVFLVEFYVQGSPGSGATGTLAVVIALDGIEYSQGGFAGTVSTVAGQSIAGRAIIAATAGQTITLVNNSEQSGAAGADTIILSTTTNTQTAANTISVSLYVLQIG